MNIVGIDLGIKKIALSYWEGDILKWTDAYESSSSYRPQELLDVGDFAYDTLKHGGETDYVFIEDTLIGNNRKYSIALAQTMGAVLASLALLQAEDYFGIYTVNVSTWKKEVLGAGNASKDTIRDYIYSSHSAYSVLCGSDQDRFDAACIGYYGVKLSLRAKEPVTG